MPSFIIVEYLQQILATFWPPSHAWAAPTLNGVNSRDAALFSGKIFLIILKSALSSEKKPFFHQTTSILTFSFWFVVARIICVFKLWSFSVASLVKNIMLTFSIMAGCFEVTKKKLRFLWNRKMFIFFSKSNFPINNIFPNKKIIFF